MFLFLRKKKKKKLKVKQLQVLKDLYRDLKKSQFIRMFVRMESRVVPSICENDLSAWKLIFGKAVSIHDRKLGRVTVKLAGLCGPSRRNFRLFRELCFQPSREIVRKKKSLFFLNPLREGRGFEISLKQWKQPQLLLLYSS